MPATVAAAEFMPMDPAQSLRLLATAAFGRLVFTSKAMPAVRPVNHVIDDDEIVLCTSLPGRSVPYTGGVPLPDGTVVAYEADALDTTMRTGWSVVVVGLAKPITDPARIHRCQERLAPWVQQPGNDWISIHPHTVTGMRLTR
jgi:nitroimidazol reductase NimA-like FMN-containing flavoprotein (pyridoxamine 5'-phosphate oxidase superfamily)